jgi:hypothetical protein
MGTRSSEAKDRGLTERQRERLRHVKAAEGRGEALTDYAKRRGLSVRSLYEAKRSLRRAGLTAKATRSKAATPRALGFVELAVRERPIAATASSFRVQFPNGTVFEWSDAPQGESLRELVGIVS